MFCCARGRLDFRRLPGPVFDPPRSVRAHFPEQRLVIEPMRVVVITLIYRWLLLVNGDFNAGSKLLFLFKSDK